MLTFQQTFQQDDGTPGAILWECPYFDLLPQLPEEDFAVLKADIKERGQQYSIIWRTGSNGAFVSRRVLDGFHRLKAGLELLAEGHDVKILSRWLNQDMTPEQEEDFVLALNLKRRHLTPELRQEWALKLRQKGKSYRQIGETLGVDAKTAYRDVKEATVANATVELPSTTKGKDGAERPATKPRLSISDPTERTSQTLYDEALDRKEGKVSNNATFRAEDPSAALPQPAPSLANEITENKAPTPPQTQKEEEEGIANSATTARDHVHYCPNCKEDLSCSDSSCKLNPDFRSLRGYARECGCALGTFPAYTPPTMRVTTDDLRAVIGLPPLQLDPRLHYHSCPACYEHKPCSMDCSIEPDAYDEKTGRKFGATCRCDECGPEVEECDDGNDQAEDQEEAEEVAKRYIHWNTPPEVCALIDWLGGADLDPCSNPHATLKAAKIFTAEDDGLSKDWGAYVKGPYGLIYVNPPYSTAGQWARKCAEVSLAYPCLDIVFLVPARTGARWFHDWLLETASAICWWRGRIQFWKEGKPVKGSANFDPCFALWGPSVSDFAEIFAKNFKGEPNKIHNLLQLREMQQEAAE